MEEPEVVPGGEGDEVVRAEMMFVRSDGERMWRR